MDFGDILEQWDASQKKTDGRKKQNQVSRKKANAPALEEREAVRESCSYEQIMEQDSRKHVHPMDLWLRRYGTIDKDKISEENQRAKQYADASYIKSLAPEAVIDLHHLTREEAWNRLNAFVSSCCKKRLRKILIIHGKGNHTSGSDPVLGPLVRLFVEQDKRLGAFGHPERKHGGSGATWVVIRQ